MSRRFKRLFSVLGGATICILALLVFFSQESNSFDQNEYILFRKSQKALQATNLTDIITSRTHNSDFRKNLNPISESEQKDASQTPKFELKLNFVTPHLAPVRECNVVVTIDNKQYPFPLNDKGAGQLSENLVTSPITNEIPVAIRIKSGITGEEQDTLINDYTAKLTQSSTDKLLYVYEGQFTYKDKSPLPTRIQGQFINQLKEPLADLEFTISYEEPIFQDEFKVKTDAKGNFDIQENQKHCASPTEGNIVIKNNPEYKDFDLKKDTAYKEGFYLMNHYNFAFEKPLVIKFQKIFVDISGQITNRKGTGQEGVKIVPVCESGKNKAVQSVLKELVSDSKGNFDIKQRTTLEYEEKILCELKLTSSDGKIQMIKKIDLLEKDEYKAEKLNIPLSSSQQEGFIIGTVVDSKTQKPVQGAKASLSITSIDKIDVAPVITDDQGKFKLAFNAFKEEEYAGDLIISGPSLTSKTIPVKLNLANNFQIDQGTIPVDVIQNNVEGKIFGKVVNGSNEPIPNANVNFEITGNDKTDVQPVQTNEKGEFTLNLNCLKDQVYSGDLVITGQHLKTKKVPVTLNAENHFTVDKGIIPVEVIEEKIKAKIFGKVVNEANEPVPNVNVNFEITSPDKTDVQPVQTNEQGEFTLSFDCLKDKVYSGDLVITGQHLKTKKVPVTLNAENNFIADKGIIVVEVIEEKIKAKIFGKVVNEANEPVPNVNVNFEITSPDKTDVQPVQTNEQGEFTLSFDCLKDKVYSGDLVITGQHLKTKKIPVTLNAENNFSFDSGTVPVEVIAQTTQGKIFGKVVNDANEPVPNAKVSLEITSPDKIDVQSVQTNEQGEFTLNFTCLKDKVYSGDLVISGPELKTKKVPVTLNADNNFSVDAGIISLESAKQKIQGQISGKVVNEATGQPIKDAFYIVKSIQPPTDYANLDKKQSCDQNGQFNIELDLKKGNTYDVTLVFENQSKSVTQSYKLDEENKYTIKDLVIKLKQEDGLLNGQLDGFVYNLKSKPVQYANVIVTVNEKPYKTFSAQDGFYKVSLPSDSAYVAKVEIQNDRFVTSTSKVEFNPSNQFKVSNYNVKLEGALFSTYLTGRLIDELSKPVPSASVDFIIYDRFREPTQTFPSHVLSDSNGNFKIEGKVREDEDFISQLIMEKEIFHRRVELFDLNKDNNYTVPEKTIMLERLNATLIYSAVISNKNNDPMKLTSLKVLFDDDAHFHKAQDLNSKESDGELIKATGAVMRGYDYKAVVEIIVSGFEKVTKQVSFTKTNNYTVENEKIELTKILVKSLVSIKAIKQDTNFVLKSANFILLFTQQEFKSYSVYNAIANDKGELSIMSKLPSGYTYDVQLICQLKGYQDKTIDNLTLSSDNNYSINDLNVYLEPVSEDNNLLGSIKGKIVSQVGKSILSSHVQVQHLSSTMDWKEVKNQDGQFEISKIPVIKHNKYFVRLHVQQEQQQFSAFSSEVIVLSEQNNYQIHADIVLQYQMQPIIFNGAINFDNESAKSDSILKAAQISIFFFDSLNAHNTQPVKLDASSKFSVSTQRTFGVKLEGVLQIALGEESNNIRKQFTLEANQDKVDFNIEITTSDDKISSNESKIISKSKSQKSYSFYDNMDYQNTINIESSVYEVTPCSRFRRQYLPFFQIQLVTFTSDGKKLLLSQAVSDLNGHFLLVSPRPLSEDITAVILIEKDGYESQSIEQILSPSKTEVKKIQIQVNNLKGVTNCSYQKFVQQNKESEKAE